MWARQVQRVVCWGAPAAAIAAIGKLAVMPHRLHVVFDLDATLIDTTRERNAPTADLSMSFNDDTVHYSAWLRPHAKAILWALKHTNQLYVFTAATKDYADQVVGLLGPSFFDEVLSRESLMSFPRRPHHRVSRRTSFAKDLRSVRAIGNSDAELARAVLVDDKATNQVADQHILVVRPFSVAATTAWRRDIELLRVAAIITLCNLGGEEVTRRVLSSPPQASPGPRAALKTDH